MLPNQHAILSTLHELGPSHQKELALRVVIDPGDIVSYLDGLQQSQFARMCKISVRTLVHIEHGEGNQTLKSLNAVFRPFGLQMGVVKVRRDRP